MRGPVTITPDDIPEPDRAPGAPHPRETEALIGQDAAEAAFLEAYTSGRLHHGWLITGPRGVGKATLAWKLARFLLTVPGDDGGMFGAPPPPTSLEADPNHPALARIRAGSEPNLFVLRRPWDEKNERLRAEITVDEVRRLSNFFALSATEGGRRVVILDAADELNTNAANAILKLLEEPPANTVMLLISHQPARLLPTILSRCRRLACRSLDPDDLAQALAATGAELPVDTAGLAELSSRSVGDAIRLVNLDGLKLYAELAQLFAQGYDRAAALKLADGMTGRANADRFAQLLDLVDLFLARLARHGLQGPAPEAAPGEAALFAKLCPGASQSRHWAELAQTISARARHGQAVNLDPAALILDITFKINEAASAAAAA